MAGIREVYENAKQKFANRETSAMDPVDVEREVANDQQQHEQSETEQAIPEQNPAINYKSNLADAPSVDNKLSSNHEGRDGQSKKERRHSHGLDSLFTSTEKKPERVLEQVEDPQGSPSISQEIPTIDFDGRTQSRISVGNAHEITTSEIRENMKKEAGQQREEMDARTFSQKPRQVVVIDPDNMEEAKIATDSLKKGDVVIIDLRKTDGTLASRFLDFSFGATSALGGAVDAIENKVYSITVGDAITDIELKQVRADGLL